VIEPKLPKVTALDVAVPANLIDPATGKASENVVAPDVAVKSTVSTLATPADDAVLEAIVNAPVLEDLTEVARGVLKLIVPPVAVISTVLVTAPE